MTGLQDGLIFALMALRRAYVLDAAMSMIDVVPVHEFSGPSTRSIKVGKTLGRKLRAIFGSAKQRLRVGVVVTYARPARAARVKLLVASFMRPTAEYRWNPNAP